MSLGIETTSQSVHIKYGSRETIVDALLRMGTARGVPVPVWPPRRLPFGLYISPVRNGWISIWSPLENTHEWFPELTATLEAPGVVLQVIESEFWIAEFYLDGEPLGRWVFPTEAGEQQHLWDLTYEIMSSEGVEEPEADEGRFTTRLDEVARSEEYQEDLQQMRAERPTREALLPFLPPHANLEQAWALLTATDREEAAESPEDEGSLFAEDYMDDFASYLGIRDAAWNPGEDAEALSEGDYEEEEGLPEGWRDFIVLPVPHLPVIG